MIKKFHLIKIIVCILPLLTVGIVFIFKNLLYKLSTYLPTCPIYKYFHVYCPGCGNTRSVQHLLIGDILGSLKFNVTPVFLLIIGLLVYIELIFNIFGKRIRILPRDKIFWSIIAAVFLFYFIIRNFVPLF